MRSAIANAATTTQTVEFSTSAVGVLGRMQSTSHGSYMIDSSDQKIPFVRLRDDETNTDRARRRASCLLSFYN